MRYREHHNSDRAARPPMAALTIRALNDSDGPELVRLAQRDSAAVPQLPLLGAELGGRLVAAASIREPELPAIADPFVPTTAAVSILRIRAAQLRGEEAGSRERMRMPQLWPFANGAPARR